MKSKLSYAIAVILGGSSAGLAIAAPASDTETGGSDTISEIIVTAQRRSESIQDVPISIQALTAQTLQQLNIATFGNRPVEPLPWLACEPALKPRMNTSF